MKEILNNGQVLGREEMKQLMAGSGGQECNCLYCFNDSGVFKTFDVSDCSHNPVIECQFLGGFTTGNYGLC